jgi:hypothetical protein
MRRVRTPQLELGEAGIEDIDLDTRSRDDIPALLLGLQHLYADETLLSRLFALMDEHVLPGVERKVGRPGMEMWRILVMGVIKQGLGCDFDRLHDLVNEHKTLRRFLGHGDIWNEYRYKYQRLVDNVGLLRPELLVEVNRLIVESGHAVAGKKPGAPLRGRCDSLVVETNVHYPTDVSLLWDAMRCLIRERGRAAVQHDAPGWRQWKHLMQSVQKLFHKVRSTRRAPPERVEDYLVRCRTLALRAETTLPVLIANGADTRDIEAIKGFLSHAIGQVDQVERRLLKGERISQHEKVFSIFEPHTRWISKGKAGCPVELGVPVCILEDAHGFVLHHEVMWQGGDVDHAVSMVQASQARFPDLRAVSFESGFHSPGNRIRLDDLLDHNVLPKKGCLSQTDRERERGDEFVAMRPQHPAVESAINNLGHRGLERVLAQGGDGFARVVALSVVAMNIHRIGLLLRRKIQRRHAT